MTSRILPQIRTKRKIPPIKPLEQPPTTYDYPEEPDAYNEDYNYAYNSTDSFKDIFQEATQINRRKGATLPTLPNQKTKIPKLGQSHYTTASLDLDDDMLENINFTNKSSNDDYFYSSCKSPNQQFQRKLPIVSIKTAKLPVIPSKHFDETIDDDFASYTTTTIATTIATTNPTTTNKDNLYINRSIVDYSNYKYSDDYDDYNYSEYDYIATGDITEQSVNSNLYCDNNLSSNLVTDQQQQIHEKTALDQLNSVLISSTTTTTTATGALSYTLTNGDNSVNNKNWTSSVINTTATTTISPIKIVDVLTTTTTTTIDDKKAIKNCKLLKQQPTEIYDYDQIDDDDDDDEFYKNHQQQNLVSPNNNNNKQLTETAATTTTTIVDVATTDATIVTTTASSDYYNHYLHDDDYFNEEDEYMYLEKEKTAEQQQQQHTDIKTDDNNYHLSAHETDQNFINSENSLNDDKTDEHLNKKKQINDDDDDVDLDEIKNKWGSEIQMNDDDFLRKKAINRCDTEEITTTIVRKTEVTAKQRWHWAYNKIIMQLNVSRTFFLFSFMGELE